MTRFQARDVLVERRVGLLRHIDVARGHIAYLGTNSRFRPYYQAKITAMLEEVRALNLAISALVRG